MLFNSHPFLCFFLPVALIGYYGLGYFGPRAAAAWLALVSLVFYGWSDASLLILLGASIAFNYTAGALILRLGEREQAQQRVVVGAIAANLLLLFYYKYLATLLAFGASWGLPLSGSPWSIVLPIGISFFTFTQIGYLVDCKAGIVKRSNLLDYVLFVTFFPHLISGPILHHREMMPQFADPETYRFRRDNLFGGALIVLIGLTKKLCIADQLSETVSGVFDASALAPAGVTWIGAIAYTLQLYFDFSGYSDMALGLAKMFGVRFPLNFDSPLRATSIIDYWQRWHMTLTRYLTLYLYNPIALMMTRRRAKAGLPIGNAAVRKPGGFLSLVAFPVFATMTLAGIWHGAGLQFVLFGLMHSAYLTINNAWRSWRPKPAPGGPGRLAVVGSTALTLLAVIAANVVFRASSGGVAVRMLCSMVGVAGGTKAEAPRLPSPLLTGVAAQAMLPWLVLLLFFVWLLPNTAQIFYRFSPTLSKLSLESPIKFAWQPNLRWASLLGLCVVLVLMGLNGRSEFLYFRF